ncbi:MAG: hypothetical protein KY446_07375 [Proteobacteria bacterium]|nr:hypothetical protein [Pseudomonadota bacterium]
MKPCAILLLTACTLVLGACANALPPRREARTDAPLPEELTRRLETVRRERAEYPDFRNIPVTPTDVRRPAQFRRAVNGVKGAGAELQAWAAANPPLIADVEAFAAEARRQLGIGPEDIPPANTAAEIEALARELRRRAEPPPPIRD